MPTDEECVRGRGAVALGKLTVRGPPRPRRVAANTSDTVFLTAAVRTQFASVNEALLINKVCSSYRKYFPVCWDIFMLPSQYDYKSAVYQ